MQHAKRAIRRMSSTTLWLGAIALVAAASATAGGMITGAQIENGSVRGIDIRDGSLGWGDLSHGVKQRLIDRAAVKAASQPGSSNAAAPGLNGKDGKNGVDGEDGAPGLNGKDGAPGADGKDGAPGQDGKDAPVDNLEYGVFSLYVDRAADGERFKAGSTPWATIATPNIPDIGVPATTNATFSVSCRPNHGTIVLGDYCLVAIRGAVRGDEDGGAKLIARVQVNSHGDTLRPAGTPSGVMVYGSEGENNSTPLAVPASPASSTAPTALDGSLFTLGWGSNSLTGAAGTVLNEDGSNGTGNRSGVYLKLPASSGSGYQITLTGIAFDDSGEA